jgi:S1-C subfamily serine protease
MGTLFAQMNAELGTLVETVRRSVVQLRDARGSSGAGTIWHHDGLIVTNAHVVRTPLLQVVLQDGRTLPGRLIARDPEHDLAAVAVEATGLPTIEVGSASDVRPGQFVFAIGHPFGVLNAATGGVVIGRGAHIGDLYGLRNDWIVVDVQLRPGNSGGPLVDTRGRMIGVNTVMNGPEVGAAVSIDAAKTFLRQAFNLAQTA